MMTVLQHLYVGPLGVGVILFAISAVYFVANRHQFTARRILKSGHGILFLCMMYPVVVREFSVFTDAGWLSYPFWVFLALGIASTAYSLGGYAKHWSLHLLHIFTVLYGALAALYGMHALPPDPL